MKRIIAILLAAVMCFAIVGCNGASKQDEILGEWVYLGEMGETTTILADGTGTIKSDGYVTSFTWEYDEKNDKYNVTYDVTQHKGEVYVMTTEGITYLAGVLGFCFRAEDREAAVAAERAIMDAYIDRCMEGKTMLPTGEKLEANGATVEINNIRLTKDNALVCDVIVEASKDLNRSKVMRLISGRGMEFFAPSKQLAPVTWGVSMIIMTDNGIAAGEALETELTILDHSMIEESIEKWGELKGYVHLTIGENEYCIDVREYTKK